MDGIKNIKISNFRGIDHLTIDDFSMVNVFLGQNNSGKTTMLEAIAMLMSMSNPDVPQAINAIRARKPFSNFIDVQYFFNNLDVTTPPEVKAELSDGSFRHLTLALSYVFDELADPKNEPVQQTGSVFYVNTLEMNFDITNGTATQSYASTPSKTKRANSSSSPSRSETSRKSASSISKTSTTRHVSVSRTRLSSAMRLNCST